MGLLAATLLACGSTSARADFMDGGGGDVSVLASQSVLMPQSGSNTTVLSVPGAGELFVTLTDLQFPTSFASLEYAVSNVAGVIVPLNAAGKTATLNLTVPTTLYANVFATLGSGSSAGLYNLTATFVAVPLPSSIVSFSGGALLFVAFWLGPGRSPATRRRAGEYQAAAISA